ncbi:hypothetical protein [Pseudomonas cichorii]|nr:hypothetical protein [Pseudomonas cichorii]AHF65308.1 hypothetical protein PCH70_01550 [Pseudomonas cichorii JBC1]
MQQQAIHFKPQECQRSSRALKPYGHAGKLTARRTMAIVLGKHMV